MHAEMRFDLLDRRHLAAGDDPDAVLFQFAAQMPPHVVVESAQDIVATADHRHLRAETGENGRELERDVAAAMHQDAARKLGQLECVVRRDCVLDARDNFVIARRPASGDQDMAGPDAGVAAAHLVRALLHRAVPENRHPRLPQRGDIGRFEACDLLVLVGDQRRPVEDGMMDGPAETRRILELLREARRVDQQLFRDAAADDAGSADAVLLGDRDLGPVAGRNAGRAHAARARPDDEEIDLGRQSGGRGHRL